MINKTIATSIVGLASILASLPAAMQGATPSDYDVPPAKPVICAIKAYDNDWTGATDNDAGVYTIGAYPGGEVKQIHANQSMAMIRAAVKKNSTMYCISASDNAETAYYSQYSTSTWTSIGNRQETDIVNIPTDLTYDPTTDNVYGWFFKDDMYDNGYYRFCSFNLTTGEANDIADTEREGYAIAADDKGTIYMLFGAFDYLATIDPKTGNFNRIKSTKLYPSYYNSMVYDETTDRLFAIVTSDTGTGATRKFTTALHSINPHTGDVTTITTFPSQQGYVGLFMMPYSIPASAPDAPSDITAIFPTADATTGIVSLTAPSKTYSGAPLNEPLMAIVEIGGVEYIIRDIQPGATVTSQQIDFTAGQNIIKVTMTNATDRGGSATAEIWAGTDIPSAVTNLLLSETDGQPQLTWTAPTVGLNGGKIDSAGLSYKIIRNTDRKTVATAHQSTTFTDTDYQGGLVSLSYSVTPVNSKGEGPSSTSNKLVIGGGYDIPFTETFDNAAAFDLWSIENLNGGSTWIYDKSNTCAKYQYDPDRLPGDDWLISPSFELKAGEKYRLSYSFRAADKKYPESFEVKLGTSPHSSDLGILLKSHTGFTNTAFETESIDFSVETDGKYNLGFHNFSEAYMYYMLLDNISLKEIDSRVPAAVNNLTVTAGEKGILEATIDFTTPATDSKGNPLEKISKIEIYRNDDPTSVHIILQTEGNNYVEPDKHISWTDRNITKSGIYTYRVVASTEAGEGADARAKAYVGTDVPGAVTNLQLKEIDGKAVLSWEKPAAGANGGWFDQETLCYNVYRYTDYELIAEKITTQNITDNTLRIPSGRQEFVSYVVFSYSDNVRGGYAESQGELFGTPYNAPLTETFPTSDMNYYPWIAVTDVPLKQAWTLDETGTTPATTDQNGDRGLATFHSFGETTIGAGSYFLSPKISVDGLDNPELSFWMYHSSNETTTDETIEIVAATDGGEFTTISPAYHRDNGTTGWTRHSISLSSLSPENYIRIGFKGTTAGGMDVYIDNISIGESVANDLEMSSLTGPKRIAAETTATYTARITNVGSTAMSGRIELTENETAIATEPIAELQPGQEATITLNADFQTRGVHNLKATIIAIDDSRDTNNIQTWATEVVDPVIPSPFDLTGEVSPSGTALLQWQAADSKGAITDDVESYTDWIIDNVGEWTMADRDHDMTYRINKDLDEYPNQTAPKAWQVCNASTIGIDIWDECKPHSGNKMFMAIANMTYVNDDWLISPCLNGSAQTIRFFAKSCTTQNTPNERMRILYSTTDTDPANFVKIHSADYIEVPDIWTEYSYYLPQGCRYFAINCVSDGAFALFVDDISFNDLTVPQTSLTGYRILRDGTPIATIDATATAFSDPELATIGQADYSVSATYADGTISDACEPLTLTYNPAGIDQPITFMPQIRIDNRTIIITNAEGTATTVTATDGKVIFSGLATLIQQIEVQSPGIYIIRVGNHTEKAIVR